MVKKNSLLFTVLIIFFNSCQTIYTQKNHYKNIDNSISFGDYNLAIEELYANKKRYSQKDKVLFYLEEGMLLRYAKKYAESNEALTKAEYAMEELLTKSISKGLASGVLNDNLLDYTGEDYEDIYVNVFKSLNYLNLNMVEEALIEIRRVDFKLKNLETKYENDIQKLEKNSYIVVENEDFLFYNDALARYIGILAYRLENLYDDSRIEQEKLYKAYSDQSIVYNFNPPNSPAIDNGKTELNILSFSGFSPEKIAYTIYTGYFSNGLFISSDNEFLGIPNIYYTGSPYDMNLKLQFPMLQNITDPVYKVEVKINGISYGYMDLIEDINNVARETFKIKKPLIIAKTIIRAISKSMLSDVSEQILEDNFGVGYGLLSSIAGDIYMHTTENSDLRISRYFPGKVRGIELPIEPGTYDISILYLDSYDNVIFTETYNDFAIQKSGLNLIESTLLRRN